MSDKPNFADIRLGISLLFKPGQLVELRVKTANAGWRGFYFDDHDRLADTVAGLDNVPSVVSLYYVINAVKPRLIRDRAKCPCDKCKGGGLIVANPTDGQVNQILKGPPQHLTSNDDIETLNWLFIDVDTTRTPGFEHESSTKEEKSAARDVANQVLAHLDGKGWSQPLLGDSGNGYHILVKVNLLNAPHNVHLLVDCLKALAATFDSPSAKIDASVFNPARLTRAYGTTTRKGTHTDERPFRRNRLRALPLETVIGTISLDQILALGNDAPRDQKHSSENMPVPREDFDPEDYFRWFEEQGAFEITGEREWHGRTIKITNVCLNTGHKHNGSKTSGFVVGDSFGWKCFSNDCEGVTLAGIHKKLREQGYESFPHPIFEDGGYDEVVEFAEHAASAERASITTPPDDRVVEHTAENAQAPTAEPRTTTTQVEKLLPDADWLTKLLAVIFKDPKGAYGDFAIWRNRLQWLIEEKAWPRTQRPVLELLLEYERKHRKLPTRDELIDAAGSNVEIVGVLSRIGNIEEEITLDYAADKIIAIGEALDERRTAKKYIELLENGTERSKVREYVRKRWSHGISADRARVEGSVQDHQDEIFERFRKMGLGEQDDNPLSFSTPFPSINEVILSDQERCFALIGPPNNFKTSVTLSLSYSLGRQGKPTLLVTGEHEPEKLEERITLLHAFYKRERFTLPSYKEWSDGKVAGEDVRNLRECCDDWKALVSVPGPIVVRQMSEFDYDLGKIEAYMEETHRKFQWKALVIDPFGDLLINVDHKDRWGKGSELCQKLLRMKTTYHNNAGLIVITTLQMKKSVKGKIEVLKRNPEATLSAYDAALEASEIELYSGAVQRFDMLWGVASTSMNNTKGVITCARTRHGQEFQPFEFVVDRKSHYTYEKPRMNEVSLEQFAEVVAGEGL